MSDELRTALATAIDILDSIEEPAWSGFGGEKAMEPLRAALAQHADDGEPVSVTGLRRLGGYVGDDLRGTLIDIPVGQRFRESIGFDCVCKLLIPFADDSDPAVRLINYSAAGVVLGWASLPVDLATIGDVRRLLAALGVDIKS